MFRAIAAVLLAIPGAAQAAPVDAHLYAADTAREVATLVKPGAALFVDVPADYYQMAVVAQLKANGFAITSRPEQGGMPVRFALADAGSGGAARVDLVVGVDTLWRGYEGGSGRPVGAWARQAVAARPVGAALDEAADLFGLGRSVEGGSPARAMRYYRLAAELGHRDAALRLGLMLIADGKATEGLRYVATAADAGDAQAEYVLGLAYLNGSGAARDPVRGRALLTRAAGAGVVAARRALEGQVAAR